MDYQIKFRKDIETAEVSDMTEALMAMHFVRNGYDNLYVTESGRLAYIVTFEDFMENKIVKDLSRPFVLQKSDLPTENIEDLFRDNPDVDRFTVVDDGDFLFEVDSMIEMPIQNGLAKNLMALRYVEVFFRELEAYIAGKRVLLLSTEDVYVFLCKTFPRSSFFRLDNIDHLLEANIEDDYDIAFDFMLCSNIRKRLGIQIDRLESFSHVITKFAIKKLTSFCDEKHVEVLFYKVPEFDRLTCLNDAEYKNGTQRNRLGKILKDDDFFGGYCATEEERDFLKKRTYHDSYRLDDGYCYIQDFCDSPGLNVSSGMRKSAPYEDEKLETPVLNFYGPCTTFGFLVPDDMTISTIIQRTAAEDGVNIDVANRAGIHGYNELNAIMEALDTPVKEGDFLIFFDSMCDLDFDEYPNGTLTEEWFNSEKSVDEIWFLDFPGHWGYEANKVVARHIYQDVRKKLNKYGMKEHTRVSYIQDAFDRFFYMRMTHPSSIRFYSKYKDSFLNNAEKIGGLVIGDECELINAELIGSALKNCDVLYVFVFNINMKHIDAIEKDAQGDSANVKDKSVKIFLLDRFFYSKRYLNTGRIQYDRLREFKFTERAIVKVLLKGLNVKYRFLNMDMEPFIVKEISDICIREGIETVYI